MIYVDGKDADQFEEGEEDRTSDFREFYLAIEVGGGCEGSGVVDFVGGIERWGCGWCREKLFDALVAEGGQGFINLNVV